MELKIELKDIDYGALAVKLLPLIPEEVLADSGLVSGFLLGSVKKQPGILKSIIDALPQERKEELLISLLNQNSGKLQSKLNGLAAAHDIPVTLGKLEARK